MILLILICYVCGFAEKFNSSEISEKYEEPTTNTKYIEEKYKRLLNPIEISDEGTAEFPAKQKRGPSPESTTDVRQRLEQQRLEIICKFCNASELRMKTPMCKQCIPTTELLGNAKQKTFINKSEERPLNQSSKSENFTNRKEFQYKLNNREEKKMNYDTPVHLNKTEEKLNENDITEGLNSLKLNSTSLESTYKLLNASFSHKQPHTIAENSPRFAETKIWKLNKNNPENTEVSWNTNEKINNLDGRTVLPKNPTRWNSNIGINNKKLEYVEDINYNKPFLSTSATSNAHISKASNIKSAINSQKIIGDMELTKNNELLNNGTISSEPHINKERKEMSKRTLHLIELNNTNRIINNIENGVNKYTEETTPENMETSLKHSQTENVPIEFVDNVPNHNEKILKSENPETSLKNIMANKAILKILEDTSKEKTKTHVGENENLAFKFLYRNGNFEIDPYLESLSMTTEKMDSVQITTPNILSAINDDRYKNSMISKIHDLFSQYLNMEPQIDNGKYENFELPLLPPLNKEEPANNAKLMNQQIDKTEKNSNNEKNSIIDNKENVKNAPDIELRLESIKNIQHNNCDNNTAKLEDEKIENVDSESQLHFTEEKIKLPLILRQNDDGTVQLLLDKSEMCNSSNEITESNKIDEKNMCKRKTDNEDNLLKRSFNIIDHLNHDINIPDQQLVSQEITQSDIDNDLKENFYKHLINKQLKELFDSLNIEIDNSSELHTYIDDLPIDEKDQLKQYLLSSITQLYTNDLNKNMLQKEHENYMKTLLQTNRNTRIINDKKQKEENRMYFPMQSEDNNNYCLNADKLKSLIRDIIHSELQNSNLCPICSQRKCTCTNRNNNILNPLSFSLENEGRVIDKRQNNYIDDDSNDSGDVSPHGIVKRQIGRAHV